MTVRHQIKVSLSLETQSKWNITNGAGRLTAGQCYSYTHTLHWHYMNAYTLSYTDEYALRNRLILNHCNKKSALMIQKTCDTDIEAEPLSIYIYL